MSTYLQKLKDPRWQRKRLEIFARDGWACALCESKGNTLHVHHLMYRKDVDPWDYPNSMLVTRCEDCHEPGTGEAFELVRWVAEALDGNIEAGTILFAEASAEGKLVLRKWALEAEFDRDEFESRLWAAVRDFKPRDPTVPWER